MTNNERAKEAKELQVLAHSHGITIEALTAVTLSRIEKHLAKMERHLDQIERRTG